jgi:NADH dehydrogenase
MNRLIKAGLAVGGVGVAGALRKILERRPRYEPWERPPYAEFPKKVLLVGGGFGGYAAVETLSKLTRDRDDVGVMLVSRENYLVFWPMVAGVISSDIDAHNVAQPLRRALIRAGASFRRAELRNVEYEKKTVTIENGAELPYDHLVLALGAQPNYFGIPGVEEHGQTMKGISDAEAIRDRVVGRFEETTLAGGAVPPSKLTFVVIGGGATGVETAAELHTLIHDALAPDYPNVPLERARIVLLNRGPEILTDLDPALRRVARARLQSCGVEVVTNAAAERVEADRVVLKDGREVPTENVVWTAGVRPNAKLEDLDLPLSRRKAVVVDRYLRVEGRPGVWAIGDSAAVPAGEVGETVAPTAQSAVQEGEAVARNILAAIDGEDLAPFEYRSLGQLVELGSRFAVNEVLGLRFSGLLAALFWRATYLYKLESPQSRARVASDWLLGLFWRPAVPQMREDATGAPERLVEETS